MRRDYREAALVAVGRAAVGAGERAVVLALIDLADQVARAVDAVEAADTSSAGGVIEVPS